MPLIQVTAQQNTISKQDQDRLMKQFTDIVLQSEGADPGDPAARSLVWAYFQDYPPGNCYVGGDNLERAPLIISLTTPEGALDEESRKPLTESIGAIVNDVLGEYEGRLNHWVMFHEVNEGCWGGAGQLFNLATIQAAMNIQVA